MIDFMTAELQVCAAIASHPHLLREFLYRRSAEPAACTLPFKPSYYPNKTRRQRRKLIAKERRRWLVQRELDCQACLMELSLRNTPMKPGVYEYIEVAKRSRKHGS